MFDDMFICADMRSTRSFYQPKFKAGSEVQLIQRKLIECDHPHRLFVHPGTCRPGLTLKQVLIRLIHSNHCHHTVKLLICQSPIRWPLDEPHPGPMMPNDAQWASRIYALATRSLELLAGTTWQTCPELPGGIRRIRRKIWLWAETCDMWCPCDAHVVPHVALQQNRWSRVGWVRDHWPLICPNMFPWWKWCLWN